MSSPITAEDFPQVTPDQALCDAFQEKLLNNGKIAELLAYLFDENGIFTDDVYSDLILPARLLSEPIGGKTMWVPTGSTAGIDPEVWVPLTGQSISRTTYARLFALWGTTYGSDDGSTFKVPDLRDKFPMIAGATYAAASTGGAADALIGATNMPPHVHTFDLEANGAPDEGFLWPQREAGRENPAYPAGQTTSEAGGTDGDAVPISIIPPYHAGVLYIFANYKSHRGTIL